MHPCTGALGGAVRVVGGVPGVLPWADGGWGMSIILATVPPDPGMVTGTSQALIWGSTWEY